MPLHPGSRRQSRSPDGAKRNPGMVAPGFADAPPGLQAAAITPRPRKKSSANLSPLAPAALSSSRLVRGGARHLEWRAAAGQGRRPTMAPRSGGRGSRRLDEWSAGRASPRATAGARPLKGARAGLAAPPQGGLRQAPGALPALHPPCSYRGNSPSPWGERKKGDGLTPGPAKQQGRRRAPDRVPWCLSWRLPWRSLGAVHSLPARALIPSRHKSILTCNRRNSF